MSAASTPLASNLFVARWAFPLAVALALAACSQPTDSPDSASVSASSAVQADQPAHADLGQEELRKRGRLALREQRIYAPAGDNAMEYYVALRDATDGGDDSAASALMELQPYAVIGAEQAIERQDFAEAERLRRLVAAADPQAPSLARMASAITKGLFDQSRESRQSQAAVSEVEPAIAVAPTSKPTAPSATAAAPLAAQTSSPTAMAAAAVKPPVAAATPVDSRASATAAIRPPATSAVAAAARTELVALRTPAPEYPDERRARRAVGQVVASFTVNSDGTVGGIRTESIGTRHLAFERSVARTLSRWKYQPPGESRDVTMSFSFAP